MSFINSISEGPSKRETRFELLRIIAMSMVLIVHADFYSIGGVDGNEFTVSPISAWFRTVLEFSSLVCVNLFIVISGWFGIKATLRGLCSFLFQCFFFLFTIYFLSILFGFSVLSLKGVINNFLLSPMNWFILSYIELYLLSPIINSYLRAAEQQEILRLTIILITIDVLLGWSSIAPFFMKGYSPLTFIELYLAGFLLRRYWTDRYRHALALFIGMVALNSALYYAQVNNYIIVPSLFAYNSPIVFVQTIAFFAWFTTLKIKQDALINFISSSAFAVYLLHTNLGFIGPVFKKSIVNIYSQYSGLACLLLITLFCILVFILAVLFDQLRKIIWKKISAVISNCKF